MVWSVKASGPWGNSLCVVSGAASAAPFFGGHWALWGCGRWTWPVLCLMQLFRPFAGSQVLSGPWEISQNKGGSSTIVLSQLCTLRSQSQRAILPSEVCTVPLPCDWSWGLLLEQVDGVEKNFYSYSCAEIFLREDFFPFNSSPLMNLLF